MPNRPVCYLFFLLASGASGLAACGGDERLSDDAFGFLDLAPYFFDGSTPQQPTLGLPRQIAPHKGWVNGLRAEYYDFGIVMGIVNSRTITNPVTPNFAQVNPMYFFFDSARRPLFSRPVFERRTGLWHMRGGRDVLNPNPRDARDKSGNFIERGPVYSQRIRNKLIDTAKNPYLSNVPPRNVADYQRPIIDFLYPAAQYSGLWEIWEVIVPDGYEPDAIKHFETLQQGIDAGDFDLRRTQRVINCPVLDDRMYVQPTAMSYGAPRPRIEVWYRTKQGSCYLANGWEALGDANGNLFPARSDGRRLDTFDVLRFTIGAGAGARTTVVAPVARSKLYQPRVTLLDQDPGRVYHLRYINDFLSDALPRRSPADPPGYSPIRWMHDIVVGQDPPYRPGTFKRLDFIDPAQLAIHAVGTGVARFMRNFPLAGLAVPCAKDDDCAGLTSAPGGRELQCNLLPDPNLAVGEPPPGKTRPQIIMEREGGPRCDLPVVRLGEFCAPGLARCQLGPEGGAYAKPTFTITDPATGMDKTTTVTHSATGLVGGYTCHGNPGTPTTGLDHTGYCYFRCDLDLAAGSGAATNLTIQYEGPQAPKPCKVEKDCKGYGLTKCAYYLQKDAGTVDLVTDAGMVKECPAGGKCMCYTVLAARLVVDAACGGIPGYWCANATGNSVPQRNRICMRSCNPGDPDKFKEKYCRLPVRATVNDLIEDRDIQMGTTYSNRGMAGAPNTRRHPTGAAGACMWDPAFEPRDPKNNLVPGL